MQACRSILRVIVALVVVAGVFAGPRAAGAQKYAITSLTTEEGGRSKAYAINSTGQMVGWSEAGANLHSTHWFNEEPTDLHGTAHFWLEHPWPYFNLDYSEAYDISNGDRIVGAALTKIKCTPVEIDIMNAFVLRPAVLTDLGTPYPGDALTNLGTFGHPCTAHDSAAVAISNRNHVVGWADVDGAGTVHAFLVMPSSGVWYRDTDADLVNDLMIDLGTLDRNSSESAATGVNDHGVVTGWSYVNSYVNPTTGLVEAGYHAFAVTPVDTNGDGEPDQWYADADADGVNDLISDLGTLGGNNSWGRDINNAGQIVGESDTADRNTHAFVWQSGVMSDLGTLGGNNSSASAINELGHIVGWAENADGAQRACVWIDGKIKDLTAELTTDPKIVLTQARDINHEGEIAGWGYLRTGGMEEKRGFLLKPVTVADPPPDDGTTPGSPGGGTSGVSSPISGTAIVGTPNNMVTGSSAPDEPNDASGPEPVAATGLCGVGTFAMLPLTLLGIGGMKPGIRGVRRKRV